MKNLIKKYSFVGLIGILLGSAIIYFAYQDNVNKIEGKVVDGKNIVFSIGEKDYSADELYELLFTTNGNTTIATKLSQDLTDLAIEETDEMKKEANDYSNSQITQLKQSLGAQYDEEMEKLLRSIGLDNSNQLDEFFLVQIKSRELQNNAIKALFPEYKDAYKPRILKHILISVESNENEDTTELSDEVKTKMKLVEEALAAGKSFSEVATEFSDDPGSAQAGGSLGLYDTTSSSSFVAPFAKAAMELEVGTVSKWVTSEFGQHLIYAESDEYEVLSTQYAEQIAQMVFTAYPEYIPNQLMQVATDKKLKFENADLEKAVINLINPKTEDKGDTK